MKDNGARACGHKNPRNQHVSSQIVRSSILQKCHFDMFVRKNCVAEVLLWGSDWTNNHDLLCPHPCPRHNSMSLTSQQQRFQNIDDSENVLSIAFKLTKREMAPLPNNPPWPVLQTWLPQAEGLSPARNAVRQKIKTPLLSPLPAGLLLQGQCNLISPFEPERRVNAHLH